MITVAMTELISGRLRRWVRDQGASPLFTYYDPGGGERIELSGVSFANWWTRPATCWSRSWTSSRVPWTWPGQGPPRPLGHPGVGAELLAGRRGGDCGPARRDRRRARSGRRRRSGSRRDGAGLLAAPAGAAPGRPPPAGVLDYALEVRTSPTHAAAFSPGWPWPAGRGPAAHPGRRGRFGRIEPPPAGPADRSLADGAYRPGRAAARRRVDGPGSRAGRRRTTGGHRRSGAGGRPGRGRRIPTRKPRPRHGSPRAPGSRSRAAALVPGGAVTAPASTRARYPAGAAQPTWSSRFRVSRPTSPATVPPASPSTATGGARYAG